MRLGDLYKRIVEIGTKNDPRSKKDVRNALLRNKKILKSLKGNEKAAFDRESLSNPYSDTRILWGDHDTNVKTILVGIDIDTTELLMVDRLRQKGIDVDLVMSHHPGGRAFAGLYKVMDMQTDMLKRVGISKEVADGMMGERIAKVERGLHAKNCMRTIDAARLLDLPLMCAHTVADNMVTTFLQRFFDKNKLKTLGAIVDSLNRIPEYREASRLGTGPKILVGDRKRKAGRVYVDMTGGTEGSARIFSRLSQIGIGTVVGMHFSEEHYREAKKEYMNVVVAGHISSDNVGLNHMFDELTRSEKLNIIPCSGFTRFSRR